MTLHANFHLPRDFRPEPVERRVGRSAGLLLAALLAAAACGGSSQSAEPAAGSVSSMANYCCISGKYFGCSSPDAAMACFDGAVSACQRESLHDADCPPVVAKKRPVRLAHSP